MTTLRTSIWRVFKWLGSFLFFLWSLYVVATWILLSNAPLQRALIYKPHSTLITIVYGWSFVPGQVELRNVHLEVEDQNIHLYVDIPRARVKFDLLALFKRQLSISKLTSTARPGQPGIVARLELRSRLEWQKYLELEKQRNQGQIFVPLDPWTLILSGIELNSISSLRLGEWTYRGESRVTGSFRLRPGLEFELYGSTLEFKGGDVLGMLKHVQGQVQVQFRKFDVPKVFGADAYRYLTSTLELQAKVSQSAQEPLVFNSAPYVSLGDAQGILHASVSLVDGRWQKGTGAQVQFDRALWRFSEYQIRSPGLTSWMVAPRRNVLESRFSWLLNGPRIARVRKSRIQVARGGRISIEAFSPDLDLVKSVQKLDGVLRLDKIQLDRLDAWNTRDPQGLRLLGGTGQLSTGVAVRMGGELVDPKLSVGFFRAKLSGVRGSIKGVNFQSGSALNLQAQIDPLSLENNQVFLSNLEVDWGAVAFDFKAPTRTLEDPGWWMRLTAPRVAIGLEPMSLSATPRLEMRDSWPVLEYLNQVDPLSAFIYQYAKRGPLSLAGDLQWRAGSMELRQAELRLAHGPKANGDIILENQQLRGAMVARAWPLSLGVRISQSKVEYSLFAGDRWLEKQVDSLEMGSSGRVLTPAPAIQSP